MHSGDHDGAKLEVRNLGGTMDSHDLERLFAPYGYVRAAFIDYRPDTGRSTGAGLVEMDSAQAAAAAAAALDGAEHLGCRLVVSWPTVADETTAGHPPVSTPMNMPEDGDPSSGTAPAAASWAGLDARRVGPH